MAGSTTTINPAAQQIVISQGGGNGSYDLTDFLNDFASRTTDNLNEGSYNFYYTSERFATDFENELSAISTDDLPEGSTNLFWSVQRFDNAFDNKVTDDLPEGATNLYYSAARFNAALATKSTDNLTEGANNQYFTLARFDSALAAKSTDDIPEGSTNHYHTQARFDAAFGSKVTDDLPEGSTNLYHNQARFDAAFAAKTTDDLPEGTVNKYHTQARFEAAFATKTTDDLPEGTANQYHTQARFDAAFATKTADNLQQGSTQFFVDVYERRAIASHKFTVDYVLFDDRPVAGLYNVDGDIIQSGDRILVIGQPDKRLNGIYEASAGPWQRPPDAANGSYLVPGFIVAAHSGTLYGRSVWMFANSVAPTIGVHDLEFEQIRTRPSFLSWYVDGTSLETTLEFQNTPYQLQLGASVAASNGLTMVADLQFRNDREPGFFLVSATIPFRRTSGSSTHECRLGIAIGGKQEQIATRHDLGLSMKVMNYRAIIFLNHLEIAAFQLTNLEGTEQGYTAFDPHGFIQRIA